MSAGVPGGKSPPRIPACSLVARGLAAGVSCQPRSMATACQRGYDNRSPDDRKRHPSMSRWRVIPALGFAACEDSIHRSNQKSTAEGG
ncbi:hypothetical protein Q8A67_014134 [Cirrhinus molitorella]|uniref:Uncharacterized protein n=1 Tax=Cirrhinus molitorella TaxID=172907 RepID=A0AA88TI02_9TELE|nr:hypothetical protein Q8A67_014134 [Cirrhinus molitorella]